MTEQQTTIIHVRFAPDGSVTEIGERPAWAPPQQWFNHLTQVAGDKFEALSGGRGIFRLPLDALATYKTEPKAA